MTNSLILHTSDAVAVVTETISKGNGVTYVSGGQEVTIKATDNIPIYHKVAVKNVPKGSSVIKYGAVIGYATADIRIGDYVHTQNLSDLVSREGMSR